MNVKDLLVNCLNSEKYNKIEYMHILDLPTNEVIFSDEAYNVIGKFSDSEEKEKLLAMNVFSYMDNGSDLFICVNTKSIYNKIRYL